MFNSWKAYDKFYDKEGGGGAVENPTPEEVEQEQKDDIKDLLDLPPEKEEEIVEEETVEEEVEEEQDEVEELEEEPEEEEIEEEPEEEEEEEKEKKEKEEKEEADPLMSEITRLTDALQGLDEKKEEKKEEPTKEEKEVTDILSMQKEEVDIGEQSYLNPDDYKESLNVDEVKNLNSTLNKIVSKVREDTRRQTFKDAMTIFPGMMDFKVQGAIAAKEFWDRNPEFKAMIKDQPKIKSYITYRAQEIQQAHNDWNLNQVYEETEKEVKELLKERLIKYKEEPVSDLNKGKKKKPAFVKKPGKGRKPIVKKPKDKFGNSDMQDEILELIDIS